MNFKLNNSVSMMLIAGISFAALTTSCKKSTDVKASNSDNTKHDTTIYMAGYFDNAAVYTKNDTVVSLPLGSYQYSYARDISASGSDVYAVGYVSDGAYSYACYWKNGTLVVLGPSNQSSQAYAIAISGNDVYIVGQVRDANWNLHSTLWKNGTASTLDNGVGYSYATSIFISGSDIYIGGYKYQQSDDSDNAIYYKNGVETVVGVGEIDAIAVSGSNVYSAGYNWENNDVAVSFKNTTASFLADGSDDSYYYGVALSGNDVYLAGSTYTESTDVTTAKYWKNGTAVTLYEGTDYGEADDLTLIGNTVYTVGTVYKDGDYAGTYWKNQTPVYVPGVNGFSSIFTQIN